MPLRTAALIALLSAAPACENPPLEAPPAPLVGQLESPTRAARIPVVGGKSAATAVWLNGAELVPLDGETQWSAEVELDEGALVLAFALVDGAGRRSSETIRRLDVDRTPPAPPSLDPVTSPTSASRVDLTGEKEAGARLFLGGVEQDVDDAATAFTVAVDLRPGDNLIRLAAQDELGNESDPVELTVRRGGLAFSVEPLPATTRADAVTLRGTRGAGVQVLIDDDEVAAAAAPAGRWQATRAVVEGDNTFVVTAVQGETSEEETVSTVRDTTAPAAPTVTAPPAWVDTCSVALEGTRETPSGVRVNGVQVAGISVQAAWGPVSVPLVPGDNTLAVTAFDAAGNTSPAASPAPTVVCDPNGVYFAVDPYPQVSLSTPVTLTGVRAADVAVEVDGTEVVAADGGTTWSYALPLAADATTQVTVSGTAAGQRRDVSVAVFYAATDPAPPTATAPALVGASPVSVSGTRPADTAVLLGDVFPTELVPAGAATSWGPVSVPVGSGANDLVFRVRDAFGRESTPVNVTVTLDDTAPTGAIAAPVQDALVNRSVSVNGTAADDSGVDEVRVCVGACAQPADYVTATGTTTWNAIVDTVATGGGTNGALVTVDVRVDTPTLTDVPVATSQVYLVNAPLRTRTGGPFPAGEGRADLVATGAHSFVGVYGDAGDLWLVQDADGAPFDAAETEVAPDGASFSTSTAPRVAREAGGAVWIAWLEDGALGGGAAGAPGVVAVTWDGASLGTPAAVATGAAGQAATAVDVAAAGTDVAVAFAQEDGLGGHSVEYALWSGTAWDVPVPVTDTAGGAVGPADVRAALTPDGMLHVTWTDAGDLDGTADDRDVYYFRHDLAAVAADVGPLLVTDTGTLAGYSDGEVSSLAIVADGVDNARVWITWVDTGGITVGPADVLAATVVDGVLDGASLLDVSDVTGHAVASEVAVAADAQEITFAWIETGAVTGAGAGPDLLVRRYDRGGMQLEVAPTVVSTGDDTSRHPAVARDGSGASLLLWQDEEQGGGGSEPLVYLLQGEL